MIKRFRAWRARRWWSSLDTEVFALDSTRLRVTRRRGRIVGVEVWDMTNFGYYIIRGK